MASSTCSGVGFPGYDGPCAVYRLLFDAVSTRPVRMPLSKTVVRDAVGTEVPGSFLLCEGDVTREAWNTRGCPCAGGGGGTVSYSTRACCELSRVCVLKAEIAWCDDLVAD